VFFAFQPKYVEYNQHQLHSLSCYFGVQAGMSAISQLVDMGIPKTRARAALNRTKDDVMSAAVSLC
jgi:uncharacterized UBP type Zn finger protein